MKVVVIDYNAGNVNSVIGALQRLGLSPVLSRDPNEILSADKVVFPGVGEASTTMSFLKKLQLDKVIKGLKQPTLGICLGMQLMCTYSEENDTPGLDIFDVSVKKFLPTAAGEKVPHMGWNNIYDFQGQLFSSSVENDYCYFVHSYYVPTNKYTIATCQYTLPFSAAIQKGNYYATQFHPEKSGSVGEQILKNFIELT